MSASARYRTPASHRWKPSGWFTTFSEKGTFDRFSPLVSDSMSTAAPAWREVPVQPDDSPRGLPAPGLVAHRGVVARRQRERVLAGPEPGDLADLEADLPSYRQIAGAGQQLKTAPGHPDAAGVQRANLPSRLPVALPAVGFRQAPDEGGIPARNGAPARGRAPRSRPAVAVEVEVEVGGQGGEQVLTRDVGVRAGPSGRPGRAPPEPGIARGRQDRGGHDGRLDREAPPLHRADTGSPRSCAAASSGRWRMLWLSWRMNTTVPVSRAEDCACSRAA